MAILRLSTCSADICPIAPIHMHTRLGMGKAEISCCEAPLVASYPPKEHKDQAVEI